MPGNWKLFKSPQGYNAAMQVYDRLLKQLSVPYDLKKINTRFGETSLIVAGPADGQPVMLVHGWAVTATCWIPQINALAQHGFRVYAPDVIGHPGKSAPVLDVPKTSTFPQWLLEVFDILDIKQADLIGISFGGWLAAKFASLHPERVKKLGLVAPAGLVLSGLGFPLVSIYNAVRASRKSAARMLRWLSSPVWPLPPERIEEFYVMLKYWRPLPVTALPTRLTDAELAQISAPTLLLVGSQDPIFNPQRSLNRARKTLPHLVATKVINPSGHLIPLEQVQQTNEALLNFLAATNTSKKSAKSGTMSF